MWNNLFLLLGAGSSCVGRFATEGAPVVVSEYDLPITRFNNEGVGTSRASEVDSAHGMSRDQVLGLSHDKPLSIWRLRDMFDWFVAGPATIVDSSRLPRTVFCHNNEVGSTISAIRRLFAPPVSTAGRYFIIGGMDVPQSNHLHRRIVADLLPYFSVIRHEQKTTNRTDVLTSPCGLTERYFRGFEREMFAAINFADIHNKTRLGFTAYGFFFPNLNVKTYRRGLTKWLRTSTLLQKLEVPRREWYATLATSKFVITPLGNGIQTPKVVEALLVLTIPIVEACPNYIDLKNDGWPILVVETWDSINADLLARTWAALSPKLETFRRFVLLNDGFYRYMTSPPEYTRALLAGGYASLNTMRTGDDAMKVARDLYYDDRQATPAPDEPLDTPKKKPFLDRTADQPPQLKEQRMDKAPDSPPRSVGLRPALPSGEVRNSHLFNGVHTQQSRIHHTKPRTSTERTS